MGEEVGEGRALSFAMSEAENSRPNTPKMPERIVYRSPKDGGGSRPSTAGSAQRRPAPPRTPRKVLFLFCVCDVLMHRCLRLGPLMRERCLTSSALAASQMHRSMYGVVPRAKDADGAYH